MVKYVMLREHEDGEDAVHHHHTHHHHHHGVSTEHQASPYSASVSEVMEELADHPDEWTGYGTTLPELMQIVAMEWAQLQAAKNNADHKRIIEELEDLAAACIHAHKHL